MNRLSNLFAIVATLSVVAPSVASAHAFLDRAVPGVGATVTGSPDDLQLSFTQAIEVPLSGVRIAVLGGGAVAASKPTGDASDPNVLHVHLRHALRPGTYVVTWHVVSVDTHPTSGSYNFIVTP